MTEFAIVQTGGKQYKVQRGELVDVEHLDAEVGGKVELTDVRFVSNEDHVAIGTPTLEGARVVAEVQEQHRGPKIIVWITSNLLILRTRFKVLSISFSFS